MRVVALLILFLFLLSSFAIAADKKGNGKLSLQGNSEKQLDKILESIEKQLEDANIDVNLSIEQNNNTINDTQNTTNETINDTVNETLNLAPNLEDISDLTTNTSKKVQITLSAVDPENDDLEFIGIEMPSNAELSNSGVFSWTPSASQFGTHPITLRVSDGALNDSETFNIIVIAQPNITSNSTSTNNSNNNSGNSSVCGNGVCNSNETCSTCSADCGACSPTPSSSGSGSGSSGNSINLPPPSPSPNITFNTAITETPRNSSAVLSVPVNTPTLNLTNQSVLGNENVPFFRKITGLAIGGDQKGEGIKPLAIFPFIIAGIALASVVLLYSLHKKSKEGDDDWGLKPPF